MKNKLGLGLVVAVLGLSMRPLALADHMDEAARQQYLNALEQKRSIHLDNAERYARLRDDLRFRCQRPPHVGCGQDIAFDALRMEEEKKAGEVRQEMDACAQDISTCGHWKRATTLMSVSSENILLNLFSQGNISREEYLKALEQKRDTHLNNAERYARLRDDARFNCQRTGTIGCGQDIAFDAWRMIEEGKAQEIQKKIDACAKDANACGEKSSSNLESFFNSVGEEIGLEK